MRSIYFSLTLCAFALVGCGNANDGLQTKKNTRATASSVSSAQAGIRAPVSTFGACKALTVIAGSNPSFANEIFTGVQVCRGISRPSSVNLKVGAYFPTNSRFCLVPMTDVAQPETCFSVNGQAEIALSGSNYSAVVMVAESDLSAYKSYLYQQTIVAPPRGIATLPQP